MDWMWALINKEEAKMTQYFVLRNWKVGIAISLDEKHWMKQDWEGR